MSGEGEFLHEMDEVPLHVHAGNLLYLKPGFTLTMTSSTDKPLCIRMLLFDAFDIPYEHLNWLKPVPVDALPIPFYKPYSRRAVGLAGSTVYTHYGR